MTFREVRDNKQLIWNYIKYFSNVNEAFNKFTSDFTSYLSSQTDFPVKASEKLENGFRIEVLLEKVDISMDFIEYNMDIWGKLVVSVNISPDNNEELFVLYFNDEGQIHDSLEEVRPKSTFGNSYFQETFLLMIYQAILSRHSYSKI